MITLSKILSACLVLCTCVAYAQNDIGLIEHNGNVSDGYILITPEKNEQVYLIDNCGEKIHEWTFSERPGLTCYLLENGNLLRAGKDSVEIRDWNSNLVWSYDLDGNGLQQHHDIEPLPNGNILLIVRDQYTIAETIDAGKDPAMATAAHRFEKIVEIEPVGSHSANIVWEWRFFDHLVQEFDNTKDNYGVVVNHPELLDINFHGNSDYVHFNGIDYNEHLDQILLSARHTDEIYIIDHSTTTAEAAGHTGGNSGMGGDLLWRWGNPQVYQQGGASDQTLFRQHDAKWITQYSPDSGKISVFNNGGIGNVGNSAIHLVEPNFVSGAYTKTAGKFDPINDDWNWNGNVLGNPVLESKKCGVIQTENGNMLMTITSTGTCVEVAKNGDITWVYRNPAGTSIYSQGSFVPGVNDNTTFRIEKYPSNYSGFNGQNLTPIGILENVNTLSDSCVAGLLGIHDLSLDDIKIVNPVQNNTLDILTERSIDQIKVFNHTGQLVKTTNGRTDNINLPTGMYYVHIQVGDATAIRKVVVI